MRTMRNWLRDRSGNFAAFTGLAMLPICGALGVAVDFAGAELTRSRLQGVADGAALAAAGS